MAGYRWLSARWSAWAARPFEAFLFASLAVAGVMDFDDGIPFPPEIDRAASDLVFHIYGAYLLVGSLIALAAILWPAASWSRRVERLGLIMVAGGTGFLAFTLAAFVQANDGHGCATVAYTAVACAVVAVSCVARWHWLRCNQVLPLPTCPKAGGTGGS